MLTVKKQPTAFAMLLLVALPLIVSVGLSVKQKIVQHQREQRFKIELSQTIIISAENPSWVEEEKEILVDGRLFDVESVRKNGKNLVLTGYFDNKEEKIVKNIKNIELQKNKSGSPLNQSDIKFLFLPNYKETTTFSIQNNWQNIVSRFMEYTESISYMTYPAIVPPPKNC